MFVPCHVHTKVAKTCKGAPIVRIVGGWVRDKLLNRPVHDIDVVVDTVPGPVFAKMFERHLKTRTRMRVRRLSPDRSSTSTYTRGRQVSMLSVDGLPVDISALHAVPTERSTVCSPPRTAPQADR